MNGMALIAAALVATTAALAQEQAPPATDLPREELEPPGGLPQGRASGAPGAIVGAEVLAAGVPVGSVQDVVVGPDGRVAHVIVSLGLTERLVSLDWGKVRWNQQAGELITDTPPDQMAALPAVPEEEPLKFERMGMVPEARGPALPEPLR